MTEEQMLNDLYERCTELGLKKYELEDRIQDMLDYLVHTHITMEEMEKVEAIASGSSK